jgi:hypothetical protein
MTAEQRARLEGYAAEHPEAIADSGDAQDVCVIELVDAGYQEAHYSRGDHFADYLLYSMLFRGSRSVLLTYGVVSGDLSLLEYFALTMLVGVDKYGSMYHPYTKSTHDGSWSRVRTDLGQAVTHVKYGSAAPVSYGTAIKKAPPVPAGYATKQPLPSSQGSAVKAGSGNNAGEKQATGSSSASKSTTSSSKSGSTGTSPKTGKAGK